MNPNVLNRAQLPMQISMILRLLIHHDATDSTQHVGQDMLPVQHDMPDKGPAAVPLLLWACISNLWIQSKL